MKHIALWSVGVVLAFFFFLISKLPAAQVIHRIDLPNSISVSGVSGTIWEGFAERIIVDGMPIDNAYWDLSGWSLLIGQISVDLDGGDIRDIEAVSVNGPVSLSLFNLQHVEAENLVMYLPSDHLVAKAQLPIRVNMGGRFRISLNELAFGPDCQTLQGFGEWLSASIVLPKGQTDLGSFSAALSCNEGKIQMEVKEPNMLGLSFVSLITPDFKRYDATGQFKPDESLPEEISAAGRFIGAPDSDGYTRFKLPL